MKKRTKRLMSGAGTALALSMLANITANAQAVPLTTEAGSWNGIAMANDDMISTGINIRSSADEDSSVVGCLYHGGAVNVLEKGDTWTKVSSGGVTGYIMNDYLVYGDDARGLAEYYGTEGVATTWNDVPMFSSSSGSSSIVHTADANEEYILVSDEGHWLSVQTGADSMAYVPAEDVERVLLLDEAVALDSEGNASYDNSSYTEPAYDDTAYTEPSYDDSYTEPSYDDSYADQGYTDTSDGDSYADQGYTDTGYDDSYADPGYSDGSYDDGSYDDGSYSDGSYDDGSYDDGSYDDGSYDDGSYSDGSYDDGSYSDGSYDDGSYDDGSYSDGSYDDGSYSDGSYDDGSYSDGSYDDGSYDDGSYDDGSYSDGSYDDGSYNDGSYDDGSYSDGSYDDGSYDDGSYSDGSYDDGSYQEPDTSAGTDVSSSDLDLLAAIIYCEAGNQSREGMVAVGAVVMNRVNSSSFPGTIHDVIYQSGQFTPASSGWLDSVIGSAPSACYEAAQAALNGENPVGSALYFNTGSGKGIQIGAHQFY